MRNFNAVRTITKTRTLHECQWCTHPIIVGETAYCQSGKLEGEMRRFYFHDDCFGVCTEKASQAMNDINEAYTLGLSRHEAALEAVLLFHDAQPWDEVKRALWRKLTGSDEATTKMLCHTVRQALLKGQLPYGNGLTTNQGIP